MTNRLRRCSAVLCALGVLLFMSACLLLPAAADHAAHSLTLLCRSDDVTLADMQWDIFAVGERSNDNTYKLTGDFADYPVSMEDLSASALQDAADTLENYAIVDQHVPLETKKTDATGSLCFDGLDKGLYLLSGYSKVVGNTRYIPSAVLIEISDADSSLDLLSYPKFRKKELPTSNNSSFSVTKVWLHDENAVYDRPATLKIALYCDREFEREIVLDESNNWTYSWSADSLSEWRVKEIEVPDNYTVVYRFNEVQYLVINSFSTVRSSTVTPPSTEELITTSDLTTELTTQSSAQGQTTASVTASGSGSISATVSTVVTLSSGGGSGGTNTKLPQTGQLWWPVPVLAAAGLILIVVGVKLHGKSS
ncbi:MAG: Cna B-type domain-containing protein [Ruminococcus sp.]